MSAKDRRNAEGYSDPTAYAAMKNLNREEDRINKLRRAILNICEVAGFEIQGSLTFVDKRTGKIWGRKETEMSILNRLIIFLVRLRLHLKKGQKFQFDNQKTDSVYWFTEGTLMKMENGRRYESSVSLNWLLNEDCKIRAPMKALNTTFWRGV